MATEFKIGDKVRMGWRQCQITAFHMNGKRKMANLYCPPSHGRKEATYEAPVDELAPDNEHDLQDSHWGRGGVYDAIDWIGRRFWVDMNLTAKEQRDHMTLSLANCEDEDMAEHFCLSLTSAKLLRDLLDQFIAESEAS